MSMIIEKYKKPPKLNSFMKKKKKEKAIEVEVVSFKVKAVRRKGKWVIQPFMFISEKNQDGILDIKKLR